jgi:predicted transcriptional regulator
MKQSKLELYLEILKALNQRSQNSTNLLSEVKIDNNTMKNRMDFLMKQRLVTKRNCGNQGVFKNTKRGENILRYFNEIENRAFIVDVGIEVANYKKGA